MVTDWTRAKRIAVRVRDPGYSNKEYVEDLAAAFPELRLYCVTRAEEQQNKPAPKAAVMSTDTQPSVGQSARTADDEYQRTIGALLAFFWLMRLDMGGKEAFSFGVD